MGDHTSNQVSSVSQPSVTPDVARREPKDQRKVSEHNHHKTITTVEAVVGTAAAAAAMQCMVTRHLLNYSGRELMKEN